MDELFEQITNVFNFLITILCPKYAEDDEHKFIYNFLKESEESKGLKNDIEANSVRLLICMGIDVKTYKKKFGDNSSKYTALINLYRKLILGASPPYKSKTMTKAENSKTGIPNYVRFAYALSQNHYTELKPGIETYTNEEFIRISSFDSFIKYIAYKNKDFNPVRIPGDISDIPEDDDIIRFHDALSSDRFFSKIDISELGNPERGWVFVTDKTEIADDLASRDLIDLLDSLGFYMKEVRENSYYISLNYPAKFDEMSYQPTSATGDWGYLDEDLKINNGNEFFLSYFTNEKNWGKTYSVSGSGQAKFERVHLYFNYKGEKTYNFNVQDLGLLNKTVHKANSTEIISEALNRFEKA